MAKFVTISEFTNILNNMAKNVRGQYVSVSYRKAVELNLFPTDKTAPKVRIDAKYRLDSKTPSTIMKETRVLFHYSHDYERAMSKALGTDYVKGADTNRETIVPNVLMRYKSTNNTCLICIAETSKSVYTYNGKEITDTEKAVLATYGKVYKPTPIQYNTIGWNNIISIVIDEEEYRPINNINQVPMAV